jgi:polysaccharide deacetylase 2 family uncharacterized protein YibQ
MLLLAALAAGTAAADQRPVLSLVIDDLGYSLDNGIAAIELDGDHTYAVLPESIYSRRLARYAHELGKEVILHLPMQSIKSDAAQEPHVLNESMDEDELAANVHSLLDAVPFIRGVNNHMGSHLTEFDFFMRPIMDSIRGYNPRLYFLDSRTSPISVAHSLAQDAGLDSATRDVFLDNESNHESIYLQYRIWLQTARRHGSAIAIGHPYSETLEVLRENLSATASGFRFLRVSELIELRQVQDFSGNRQLPGLRAVAAQPQAAGRGAFLD